MNDLDGKFTYSKILSIQNDGLDKMIISIFPNPAADILFVENLNENTVQISNLLGQRNQFKVQKISELKSSIDISGLPKGLYFMNTKYGAKKFIKE